MMNQHKHAGIDQGVLSAENYNELLDRLYRLLVEAYDAPVLKEHIWSLIRWVELHVPVNAEGETLEEMEVGSTPLSDFAVLIAQAQQQDQQ
jgi:hypothetical protein